MSQPSSSSTFQFGEFELDVSAYQLRRSGHPVHLERQPMDLLILLVERHRQLVWRADIVKRLWDPGVFVDVEMGVNTAIRKLRHALRDSKESPSFIETVSGKGYRFIAPVTTSKAASAQQSSTPSEARMMLAVLPFENYSRDPVAGYFLLSAHNGISIKRSCPEGRIKAESSKCTKRLSLSPLLTKICL